MMLRKISILLILFFTNCATIIHGTRQKINFVSSPPGASVSVNNVNKGATPLLLKLKRNDDHLVQMSLPSYQLFQTTLANKFDALIFGNLLFGGIFGGLVDVVDGATYKLKPEKSLSPNATFKKDETQKGTKVLSVVLAPDAPTPANKTNQATSTNMMTINTANAYAAIISNPIKFKPKKKEATKDITVELNKSFIWDALTLVGVNGVSIPETVKAKYKIKSGELQAFVFDGWSLVQFLPLGTGQNEFQLNFMATSGGYDFPTQALANLDVKAQ